MKIVGEKDPLLWEVIEAALRGRPTSEGYESRRVGRKARPEDGDGGNCGPLN